MKDVETWMVVKMLEVPKLLETKLVDKCLVEKAVLPRRRPRTLESSVQKWLPPGRVWQLCRKHLPTTRASKAMRCERSSLSLLFRKQGGQNAR